MGKICPGCKRYLLSENFHKNKSNLPSGLSSLCKECKSIDAKKCKERENVSRKLRRHKLGISKRFIINGKLIGDFVSKAKCKNNEKDYTNDWSTIRKIIYKRDNWTCQECKTKCQTTGKLKIQCHHINYNTKDNNDNNLITLCASCHGKTNFKRDDWKNYFNKKNIHRSF